MHGISLKWYLTVGVCVPLVVHKNVTFEEHMYKVHYVHSMLNVIVTNTTVANRSVKQTTLIEDMPMPQTIHTV